MGQCDPVNSGISDGVADDRVSRRAGTDVDAVTAERSWLTRGRDTDDVVADDVAGFVAHLDIDAVPRGPDPVAFGQVEAAAIGHVDAVRVVRFGVEAGI